MEEAVQTSIQKTRVAGADPLRDAVGVRLVGGVHGGADDRESRQEEVAHQGKEGAEGLLHEVVAADGGESDHAVEVVAHQTAAAAVVYHGVEVDDDGDGVVVDALFNLYEIYIFTFWM